jgi:hypothetical protein
MIGEGALPAALSKPFLLKITFMVGLRSPAQGITVAAAAARGQRTTLSVQPVKSVRPRPAGLGQVRLLGCSGHRCS